MKRLKKLRFFASLTVVLVCLSFLSVSVKADAYAGEADVVDMNDNSKEEALPKTAAKQILDEYSQYFAQMATMSVEELEFADNMYRGQFDAYGNFAKAIGNEKIGAFKSYSDVKVEKGEGKYDSDIHAILHFEKMDLKMTMHYANFPVVGEQIKSIEFGAAEEEESLTAKMKSAAINTLLGMGTVFIVLIFISFLISLFKYLPKLLDRNKKEKVQISPQASDNNEHVAIETTEDNTELIAVIAAAIAASEQVSTDSFVVRSIRRR